MNWTGFIDSTYRPGPYSVDVQVCDNWYTEVVESRQGKNPKALLRTPGLRRFCNPVADTGEGRVCLYGIEDHLFAVVNDKFILITEDGTYTVYGPDSIANDGRPAVMSGNPGQVFICSGNKGYVGQAAAVHQVSDPGFPIRARGAAFIDERFVTFNEDTGEWQCSDLGDGTVWDAINKFTAEASPDFIHVIGVLQHEVWPFGSQTIQVFDDTGDLTTLFAARTDVDIQWGIGAPDSLVNIKGQWYFQERGGMIVRMVGYDPARVSDHSVEEAIRKMTDSSDAVGWTYDEKGHTFYVLYYPTAQQTWVYDLSTGRWHTRSWRNPAASTSEAHRGYSSAKVWGRNFVGDRANGLIYEMSMDYLDDGGTLAGNTDALIHRERIAPILDRQLINVSHGNFEIDGNVGIGPNGLTENDPARDPAYTLQFSDDGGKSWSMPMDRGAGAIGDYDRLVIWRRLGSGRRRVYRLTCSAAVDWAIAAVYINKKRE